MIRWLGAIMIVGAGFLAGHALSLKLKYRVRELEAILAMGEQMATYIRYQGLPLPELFEQLSESSQLKELPFIKNCALQMKGGVSFPVAYRAALNQSKDMMHLKGEDFKYLAGLEQELGSTDLDGQLKTLWLFQKTVESCLTEAREEYRSSGMVYQRVGLFAGMALAIVIV